MNIEERKDGELMVTNGWVCAQLRFYWKAGEKSGQILGGTRLERGNYRRKDELVSRDLRASNVEIFFKLCFFKTRNHFSISVPIEDFFIF